MRVLNVRNVQEALPRALELLDFEGIQRDSRNGPVLLGPSVATVYERPIERVIFHPERDANPFFHLYESLWMLAGRNDVAGPLKYAKNMASYSDSGDTFHAAYGHRWRRWPAKYPRVALGEPLDQLGEIALALRKNPECRRQVLAMWDPVRDLGGTGKDLPCNDTATFQRGVHGELNLTVFCRSNDIVWGAYGANAVHFSFLLEYTALWIGCPVGTYTQISVNWHGYLKTLESVKTVRSDRAGFINNPYIDGRVHVTPLSGSIGHVDKLIHVLLEAADENHLLHGDRPEEEWARVVWYLLGAHQIWRTTKGARRYLDALEHLANADRQNDWIVAGREWLVRRQMRAILVGDVSHG